MGNQRITEGKEPCDWLLTEGRSPVIGCLQRVPGREDLAVLIFMCDTLRARLREDNDLNC